MRERDVWLHNHGRCRSAWTTWPWPPSSTCEARQTLRAFGAANGEAVRLLRQMLTAQVSRRNENSDGLQAFVGRLPGEDRRSGVRLQERFPFFPPI